MKSDPAFKMCASNRKSEVKRLWNAVFLSLLILSSPLPPCCSSWPLSGSLENRVAKYIIFFIKKTFFEIVC
ncbi:hypothetical protein DUNSADRAFT_17005 [Dunaliella salina]|uniref:Encoded protein n=1 Tax=Dunaliella salina TaxID=3046 RepID=A0ABQ7G2K4_DUNSA|nr:hypothetical protein DUNSADRAFT_17005 [Dunaliella salina]|eukprot:KAF5828824.1 hypothetical protein DUNSADRAFT_17005 [Dunaliella salina]